MKLVRFELQRALGEGAPFALICADKAVPSGSKYTRREQRG